MTGVTEEPAVPVITEAEGVITGAAVTEVLRVALLALLLGIDIVNQIRLSERTTLREQAVFLEVHWARRVYSPLGIQ